MAIFYFCSIEKNIVSIYPMYITAEKMAFFPSGTGQPHKNVRG
jgi:Ser-tRNA(Ala) deacylase AlaX